MTALKTISLRVRGAKTELEEAGESTDGMAESTSKLREQIKALSGVDIMIDDNTFKSSYDIIDELSEKWENLTDIQRASITELVAGKTQANVFNSLISNFDVAREALKVSANSAGSAMKENEKYLDSIQGRISKFQASWQALSASMVDSSIIKYVVSFGTLLIDFLDMVSDKLGNFGKALIAVPIVKFVSALEPVSNTLKVIKGAFSATGESLAKLVSHTGEYFTTFAKQIASGASAAEAASVAYGTLGATLQTVMPWLLALTAAFAVSKGIEYITGAVDRLDEELSTLKSDLSETTSELSSLESDLETNGSRLKELYELKSNGSLTFTEAEELEALEAENRELERNIALLKSKQEIQQQQAQEKFVERMDRDLGKGSTYGGITESGLDKVQKLQAGYKYNVDALSKIQTDYGKKIADALAKEDKESAASLQKELDNKVDTYEQIIGDYRDKLVDKENELATAVSGIEYNTGNNLTDFQKQTNAWLDTYYDIQDKNAILFGTDGAKESAIYRLMDTSFADTTKDLKKLGKQGKVTADDLGDPKYDEFIQKLVDLGAISDETQEDLANGLSFVALAFNQLAVYSGAAGSELSSTISTYQEVSNEVDSIQEKITSLSSALTSLSDGSMTLSEVIDLIQEFPELAEYVDLTAEGFGDLQVGLKKLIRESPKKLINDLKELKNTEDLTQKQKDAIDGLCVSLEKISADAIEDVSSEFGILAEQINASKRAKSDLDKVLAADDYDANFDDRVEAFEKLQEVLKNGEVGSKAYAGLKEYFGIDEMNVSEVTKWAQAYKNFFKDGKEGARAFVAEIQKLNQQGLLDPDIASYSSTQGFWYDITRMDELSDIMGFSEEIINDMIGNYRMYCEDYVDYTTEMVNAELVKKGVIQDFGNIAVASMEDIQTYTNKTGEEVANLVDEINAMNQYIISDSDELAKLGEGGNVDLTFRPVISGEDLFNAGFKDVAASAEEAATMTATVFTSTFSNEAGDVAMNFTPIMVDENGNYTGVMNKTEFEKYCEDVVNGADDCLGLKIGVTYEGSDAIAQAEADAQRIHELHEQIEVDGKLKILGVDEINFTQPMIDAMAAASDSVDAFKEKLYDLYNTKGVSFDAGVTYNGQSIEDIIKEMKSSSDDAVTVDVKMTINDDEVIASVTATAQEIEAVLGPGWDIKLNSEDAEERFEAVNTLASELPENTTLIVNGKVTSATSGLSEVLSLVNQIPDKKSITVTTNYVKNYGANENHDTSAYWDGQHATGTNNATAGRALLGDERSPDGSPKPELVITDGAAYVAGQNGPEIVRLNAGDQVIPADETKRILHGNAGARKNAIPAFAAGTTKTKAYWLAKAQEQKLNSITSGSSAYWSSQSSKTITEAIKQASQQTVKAVSGNYGGKADLSGNTSSSGSGSGGSSSSGSSSSSSNEKSQFEKDYEYHNHLVAMERESYEDYINWLQSAYRDAYAQGQIELEDFYKYEEEVFDGQKQLVQDAITDIEHKIKTLEREPGNEKQIINYYNQIIAKIDNEIALARARGLSDDDDYIQELIEQKWDYADEIADIQEEITENTKDAVDDLVDYRIDMLKQDLNNEKDALSDKLSALKDFYSKQKEMLQDAYDEEKYLEEQSEKRKSVSDIQAEIAQLQFDDSAWADKRRKELEEELKDAEKELNDFEKDHALESATDLLDKMYEQQESQIQTEIDLLDEKLNDPNALYNQALRDIQNNTLALYEEMIEYNNKYGSGNSDDIFTMWSEADKSLDAYYKLMGQAYKNILLVDAYSPSGYASGTSHATPGIHELFEKGDEYVYTTSDGKKYRMFSGLGDKVLNSTATDFLYRFANNGESFLNNIVKSLASNSGVNSVSRPAQAIQLSSGDVIINGNATQETVSEIRRAQRDNLDYVLREFRRLNK